MTECRGCGAATSGPRYCRNCVERFSHDLRMLAVGLPELRLIAARKASVVARSHTHGTVSIAPIPLNMNAYQLQCDVIRFAGMLARAAHLRHGRHASAEGLLRGVLPYARTLLERGDAPRIVSLTHRYSHRMSMQLTPPDDRRMIGTCPHCGRELWCTDMELAGGWMPCGCGVTSRIKDIQEQHLLTCALADNDRSRGTASAVSDLLRVNGIDVKRNTINQWHRRGLLHAVGDADGVPVFRVWDVWKVFTR